MNIPQGLELRVMDVDADYVLVEIAAADGMFAGTASLYSGESAVSELADGLAGFPARSDDVREIILGSRTQRAADGWVRVHCSCVNRSGQAVLEIQLLDKAVRGSAVPREVIVRLDVEAAAIDRFVDQLRTLPQQAGARALLGPAV